MTPLDFAVIVGVDHYPEYDGLADRDLGSRVNATCFLEWFLDSCQAIGSLAEYRLLVSDDQSNDATRAKIVKALSEVCAQCPPSGGRLTFYFSGHGTTTRQDGSLVDVILPSDADPESRGLLLEDIMNFCAHYPFEQQLFVVEACREPIEDQGVDKIRRPDSHPSLRSPHQRILLQATKQGALAYGRVAGDEEPTGFFTRGLLAAFRGRLERSLVRIRQLDALCVTAPALRRTLIRFLAEQGLADAQLPPFETPNWRPVVPNTVHVTRLSSADPVDVNEVSLFDYDDEYDEYLHTLITDVDLEPQLAPWRTERSANRGGIYALEGVHGHGSAWLVRQLATRLGGSTAVHRFDLGATGVGPEADSLVHLAPSTWGVDDLTTLTRRLRTESIATPILLAIVLPDPVAPALIDDLVARVWTPATANGAGLIDLLFLPSGASLDPDARAALATAGSTVLPPFSGGTKSALADWMLRRRHDLPLSTVLGRDALAEELAAQGSFERAIETLCDRLDVLPPWSQ